MKRLVVMADHDIGYDLLRYLLNQEVEILKVYTTKSNKDGWWNSIHELSSEFSIEVFTYSPSTIQKELKNLDFDLLFLLSWKHIMNDTVLSYPKIGTVNLHYSLLPKYRGVYPVNQALINGEGETGVTFHWVNSDVDAGNIIGQQKTKIEYWDTSLSLLKRLDKVALQLFKDLFPKINDWYPGTTQNQNSSYFSVKDYNESNAIDLDKMMKVGDVINLFRGKSFGKHKKLYFLDQQGKKIYVSISLEHE